MIRVLTDVKSRGSALNPTATYPANLPISLGIDPRHIYVTPCDFAHSPTGLEDSNGLQAISLLSIDTTSAFRAGDSLNNDTVMPSSLWLRSSLAIASTVVREFVARFTLLIIKPTACVSFTSLFAISTSSSCVFSCGIELLDLIAAKIT